jgi:hypothetical protein
VQGELAALGASEWAQLWLCGEPEAIIAGFRRLYVKDRERAESLLKRLQVNRYDEVISHFAGALDEDELTDAERDEELRAALEALDDNEWIAAEEARLRLRNRNPVHLKASEDRPSRCS